MTVETWAGAYSETAPIPSLAVGYGNGYTGGLTSDQRISTSDYDWENPNLPWWSQGYNHALVSEYRINGSEDSGLAATFSVAISPFVFENIWGGALESCVGVSYKATSDDTPDLGPCDDCNASVGSPINVTNGNTDIEAEDYTLPGLGGGLALKRTWNSLWQTTNPISKTGMFGDSWRSTYEEQLQLVDFSHIKYWRNDGSAWEFAYNGNWVLQAPADQYVNLSFDAHTTLYTLSYRDGSQKIFNNAGYLIAIKDRNGNTTNLSYDTSNRLVQVTDTAGRSLTFTYGDSNNPKVVTAITDAVGTVATYSYDSSSHLLQVTYADGSSNQYSYDSNGLIASVVDGQGKVLEAHTYDAQRRGLSSERANGVDLVTLSYPAAGTTQITSSVGATSTYGSTKIAKWGKVTSVAGTTCASCGAQEPASYTYDAQGNKTSITDALGHVTNFTYDSFGDVLTKSTQVGGNTLTWSYTYDNFGEVLTGTDPMGFTTTNTYDSQGNLLSTTTPAPDASHAGSTTTFSYDSKGELVQVTDPHNNTTRIAYSGAGLVCSITDAQNHTTTYQYDARGNRISATDALGNVTTYSYDARNRLTQVTNPDQSVVKYTYDSRGRRTSVTDGNGKTTSYSYDDADRLLTVTDAAQHVTQYAYDTENDLTAITDALGHQTTFAYDNERRVTSTVFPSQLAESYTYDADGNLLSKTDRNGNTINFTYDELSRLINKQYPNGAASYSYDADGRMVQVADATGTYKFTYDNMGRLTTTTVSYSFLPGTSYSVAYSYDAASNRTGMADPQGGITAYAYDNLNRLTGLTDPQSNNFSFSYDALGRRTGLGRSNGVTTTYQYDSLSRLLAVLHNSPKGGLIDGNAYTYDNAGNRLTKVDYLRQNPLNWSYTYDTLYQLTQAVQNGTPTESYSYDQVGNRLSSQATASYSYNDDNELVSNSSATYTYDNNGNRLTKTDATGVTAYTWDYDNRLTSVTLPGGSTVTFKYDPFGRRIQKFSAAGTSNYVYDGANLLEELDATGTMAVRYTEGGSVDEPLATLRLGNALFYEADGLGSITSLTKANGTPSGFYSYDSFGNVTLSGGRFVAGNTIQYTGREWDQETGLYYYRARYYDPQIGRFISEDPIAFRGGINFYRYVHNLPTTSKDPFGFADCDAVLPSDPDAALLAHLIAGEATWRKNNTTEMAAIAYTVVNRLDYLLTHPNLKPGFFGGTDTSIAGLITPSQYGSIGNSMWNLTDNVSSIDTACSKGKALCDFFKNAFDVADGVRSGDIADPFADYGGAFAMRTKGHGGPGGLFTNIPPDAQITDSNNVFFGLSQ